MSPWTDMTMSGASYRERVESDPMLTPEYIETVRRAYAGDRDLHDPDLSPLLGDLGSFPPTLIQVGDHEILYSDSASLAAALRAAHVPCRLEVSEGMWHVFQMFPIKKAAAAMESAAGFCWSYKNKKACSKEQAFCFCSQVRSKRRMGRMYLKAGVL